MGLDVFEHRGVCAQKLDRVGTEQLGSGHDAGVTDGQRQRDASDRTTVVAIAETVQGHKNGDRAEQRRRDQGREVRRRSGRPKLHKIDARQRALCVGGLHHRPGIPTRRAGELQRRAQAIARGGARVDLRCGGHPVQALREGCGEADNGDRGRDPDPASILRRRDPAEASAERPDSEQGRERQDWPHQPTQRDLPKHAPARTTDQVQDARDTLRDVRLEPARAHRGCSAGGTSGQATPLPRLVATAVDSNTGAGRRHPAAAEIGTLGDGEGFILTGSAASLGHNSSRAQNSQRPPTEIRRRPFAVSVWSRRESQPGSDRRQAPIGRVAAEAAIPLFPNGIEREMLAERCLEHLLGLDPMLATDRSFPRRACGAVLVLTNVLGVLGLRGHDYPPGKGRLCASIYGLRQAACAANASIFRLLRPCAAKPGGSPTPNTPLCSTCALNRAGRR